MGKLSTNIVRLERIHVLHQDLLVGLELNESELLGELSNMFHELQSLLEEVQDSKALEHPHQDKGVILTVISGAGGMESQDWAHMLFSAYAKWALNKGLNPEVVDVCEEKVGIRSGTLVIRSKGAYGLLRNEKGAHRIQRVSPYGKGERHTSFAGVEITPLIELEVEDIDLLDVHMSTFRCGGKGGQNVNKLETGVRLVHIPTGISVRCTVERTQLRNREIGLKLLSSKVKDYQEQQIEDIKQEAKGDRLNTGFGGKVRTYSFHPHKYIKDERLGITIHDLDAFLEGNCKVFNQLLSK